MTEEQRTVADQAEGLAQQAVSGLRALAPADKSWVAAFVLVVLIIVGADAWTSQNQLKITKESSLQLTSYLIEVEANRAQAIERQSAVFADQQRRAQETIKELVQAVSRDSERSGIAAMNAIDKRGTALETGLTPEPKMSRIPEK